MDAIKDKQIKAGEWLFALLSMAKLLAGARNRVILVVTGGFSDSKEASAAATPDRRLRERTDRDAWKINEFVLQRKNRSAVLCKSCA